MNFSIKISNIGYKKMLYYLIDSTPKILLEEDEPKFSFLDRFVQDHEGIDKEKAYRIWVEYLKFMVLKVKYSHKTPSVLVDLMWHQHITYTRSYFKLMEFIADARGTDFEYLHHDPTVGGDESKLKYRKQYEDTLELYKKEFNEVPPKDIWQSVDDRFQTKVTTKLEYPCVIKNKNGWKKICIDDDDYDYGCG